jgi:hypothetical protein
MNWSKSKNKVKLSLICGRDSLSETKYTLYGAVSWNCKCTMFCKWPVTVWSNFCSKWPDVVPCWHNLCSKWPDVVPIGLIFVPSGLTLRCTRLIHVSSSHLHLLAWALFRVAWPLFRVAWPLFPMAWPLFPMAWPLFRVAWPLFGLSDPDESWAVGCVHPELVARLRHVVPQVLQVRQSENPQVTVHFLYPEAGVLVRKWSQLAPLS